MGKSCELLGGWVCWREVTKRFGGGARNRSRDTGELAGSSQHFSLAGAALGPGSRIQTLGQRALEYSPFPTDAGWWLGGAGS